MPEELSEDELREWDEICAYVWSTDPTVTLVDAPEDTNPEHGTNTEEEMMVSVEPDDA